MNHSTIAEYRDSERGEKTTQEPSARAVSAPVQRVRELPYVDVPPLTKVVRADKPRPTEKESPAYITCAPVEQDNLGQEILEEILKAPLDMTIGQILGASPVVRKELARQIAKVRQVPEKDKVEPKRAQFKATVEDVDEADENEFLIPHDGISIDDLPYAPFTIKHKEGEKSVIVAGDPVVQYLNGLAPGETPKKLYGTRDSLALRAVYPVVNNAGTEEALLDSGSQIVSVSRDTAVKWGFTWNPDIRINMESAQGHVEETLGLAKDVPFQFGEITVLLKLHVINKPAYKLLLGRPFDALTESVVKNERSGAQTITLTDPVTQVKVVLPTYPRGCPPKNNKGTTGSAF